MKKRHYITLFFIVLAIAIYLPSSAAEPKRPKKERKPAEQTDTTLTLGLADSATVSGKVVKGKKTLKYPPYSLIGVQYSYDISGIGFSPDISPKSTMQPINAAVLYTRYMSLWDMMPFFGFQTGIRYTTEGFTSEWQNCNGTYKLLEVPLISQFNYRIGPLRLLVDGGCYYGYRLSVERTITDDYTGTTSISTAFDAKDIRNDYGFIFGGGLGFIVGPVELHLEATYKRAMVSVYQTNKISDEYWLFGYGHQLRFSAGIHIHLF